MKAIRTIAMATFAFFAFQACSAELKDDMPAPNREAQVTIRLSLADDEVTVRTKSASDKEIRKIWYVIADASGEIFDMPYSEISDDLSSIQIEGLPYGEYTIALLATTGEGKSVRISEPERLSDRWISNEGPVVGEDLFFGRLPIIINREQSAVRKDVTLTHCVGAVKIDMHYANPYVRHFVRSIRLNFDTPIPASMNAEGVFSGGASLAGIDMSNGGQILVFPTASSTSGFVDITSTRSDGGEFTRRYRFGECNVEPGKITHIDIAYEHPEEDDGRIMVNLDDYAHLPHIDTMWLADEAKDVMYSRTFQVNKPLQVSLNQSRRLQIRLFSPVPVKGVKIKATMRSISSSSFTLAEFEQLYPFMEAEFDLPMTTRDCVFTTDDGGRIVIPAQPSLSASDISLSVDTGDDPFMKKISLMSDKNWTVSFKNVSYDWSLDMTPALCRHANALVINMAYMFSTEGFDKALMAYEGQIHANNKARVIPLDEIRRKIVNLNGVNHLRCGNCGGGYGGMGGAWFYWLVAYCWTGHYYDVVPANDPAEHNYTRQAIFHEFGHVLGYGHGYEMTYGDKWTVLCAKEYCRQGREGLLPVNSASEVNDLPM